MKKKLSLRGRMMLSLFSVTAGVVLAFFVMNYVFWNVIYLNTNRSLVEGVYEEVAALVKQGNTTGAELQESLNDIPTAATITFALQGDSDWEFNLITREIVSPQQQRFLRERLQENFLNSDPSGVKVLKKTDDYTLQKVTIESDGSVYYEMYGYMEDQNGALKKFIISLPLERVYRVFSLTNQFFLLIAAVVAAVGFLLIIVITNRITQPIRQLTEISNRMKDLDFSARYTGNKTDEIGVLGNNMNELASQLERTILNLKLTNDNLKQELEEKQHVDEMRKDFISNVSHELKTPIALIQGYAEGLSDMVDDPESFKYYCDVIVDEADKMNRMVRKLMTLNQLEFGTADFTPVVFDVVDMIRSIIYASKKQTDELGITVSLRAPEKLTLYGDTFEIEEVLNNYFSNARNHIDGAKGITFSVDDLGPTARVSVHNTGEQIPEEDLNKVWTKFFKVDKARTRSYGGSGIGLAIVKAIIDAHHGEYGVYNTEDGVTFWFEIERRDEEEEGTYGGA